MGLNRRAWLRRAAGWGCAPLVAACSPPRPLGNPDPDAAPIARPVVDIGYRFLRPAEVAFVDAAVSRLIPADELGPGAAEAGVTVFIDRQLDGAYGKAVDWYMQAPFGHGSEQQGYQLPARPAELYRAAIRGIDDHCRRTFGNRVFARLDAHEQDALLHALEDGNSDVPAAHGKSFFKMLWQNTQEGYFADPMYGGNRGFAGWRLVGFPGPRYNYVAEIRQWGQPYGEPPVGVLGRDWRRRQPGMT